MLSDMTGMTVEMTLVYTRAVLMRTYIHCQDSLEAFIQLSDAVKQTSAVMSSQCSIVKFLFKFHLSLYRMNVFFCLPSSLLSCSVVCGVSIAKERESQ